MGRAGKAILGGWAADGLVRVTSAPPINVIVPGQPFWIADPTQPSGNALNPAAFASPALEQSGNFPRNGLRSPYSLNQKNLALRRQFSLTERIKLDLRAEYFNVFNHPMFGSPGSQSIQILSGEARAEQCVRLSARYVLGYPQRISMRTVALAGCRARCTRLAARGRHNSQQSSISMARITKRQKADSVTLREPGNFALQAAVPCFF